MQGKLECFRGTVYRNLAGLYPTHACREYRNVFKILERECGYSEYNVPQLEHVSNFLRSTFTESKKLNVSINE